MISILKCKCKSLPKPVMYLNYKMKNFAGPGCSSSMGLLMELGKDGFLYFYLDYKYMYMYMHVSMRRHINSFTPLRFPCRKERIDMVSL